MWLPYWKMPLAFRSAAGNADVIESASPFWYVVEGDSTVRAYPGAGNATVIEGLRNKGVRVEPTVVQTAEMAEFGAMLADPSRRAAHVRALVALVTSRAGYTGLDLDYEGFTINRKKDALAASRAATYFPVLVKEACAALHRLRKRCVITVMARTTDEKSWWSGGGANWVYDYREIGKYADRVRVMAYSQHSAGDPPGPIASYSWVKAIAAYAAATIPAAKVELALPAFGYDWSGSGARACASRGCAAIARAHRARVRYSPTYREPYFTYRTSGRSHTVWFEDATAHTERAAIAKSHGFAGVDLWSAGGEDPSVWPKLRTLYTS